jgi:signal transduction histidine kinase/DNA-binding NarL/FixJ family response regulator
MSSISANAARRRPLVRHGFVAALVLGSLLAARALEARGPFALALFAVVALATALSVDEHLFQRPARLAERKSARDEARYRQLIRDSSDLVLLARSYESHVEVLSCVEPLLGQAPAGGERLSLRAMIHPEDRPIVDDVFARLAPDQPRAAVTFRLDRSAEPFVWVEASFCRRSLENGSFEITIIIRNVTRRYREAETLRLASEAARLAQADADEANQAKSEFLARMSHEIRTPLNAVIGFGGLLLELPDLPRRARHYSERIKGASHALLTIVNDIIDFSQVEAGVVELKARPFALPLLIDECFSIVQQAALTKHLSLDVNLADRLPPGVLGDEARLRQVLLNLLNNAIKFTHEGSVLLDIRYDTDGASRDRIKFSVIDTGIGIAAEDRPRLFQRFKQVDETIRRTYGGTGLGLAISKQIVELMGGEIGVLSEKGRGSTFWFAIDLPCAPLLLQTDQTPARRHGSRLDLLLVEDVSINQELISLILEAAGHDVDIVGDGAEAIMAVQDKAYDAVLMDIQMPHVDGMTATRIIRELPEPYRSVVIIAMTANVLPEQTRLARDAGMDDVIHKPFTATDVYAVLDRLSAPAETATSEAEASPPVDARVLAKLSGLIGDAKVRALLTTLAHSLVPRFTEPSGTPEGRVALRRDAHASIAGAAMLGFRSFSDHCLALESAEDGPAFEAALTVVKTEAASVIATARSLVERAEPFVTIAA